jgi:hypothetical protein
MAEQQNSILAFESINKFINDLDFVYGQKNKPLKLYSRLISGGQFNEKHVEIFKKWCVSNEDAIENKDVNKFVEKKIIFSKRIYIDMELIFRLANKDEDNLSVIWSYLLTISAILIPNGKSKMILKKEVEENKNEDDFLKNIISKIENSVDPNADPMQLLNSVISSGVFTDLMKGLSSGKIDTGKLLNTVQEMASKHEGKEGDESLEMLKNASSLFSSVKPGQLPDMGSIMSMMSTMTNNLNTQK